MFFASMNDLTAAQRKVSNRVTGVAVGACAALAAALSVPATAAPTVSSVSDHYVLVQALEQAGVTVVLNSPAYCDSETAGAYHSSARVLAVCQENARRPYADQGWTAYDLDTLRHEAHHVVQDCLAGGLGDSDFTALFDTEREFEDFVTGSLDSDEIDWVISSYASSGASDEVIMHELEAFAAAKVVSPGTIAEVVEAQCTAPRFKF